MTVVVDTTILFNACLTSNAQLGEILFSPLPQIQRISCQYAFAELIQYQPQLVESAKQPADQINKLVDHIQNHIEFYSEDTLGRHYLKEAERLTVGVETDGIAFVAMALQQNGCLWTENKTLASHLKSMGFSQVYTTPELFEFLFF